jgi:hypothetical protein
VRHTLDGYRECILDALMPSLEASFQSPHLPEPQPPSFLLPLERELPSLASNPSTRLATNKPSTTVPIVRRNCIAAEKGH